MKKLRLLLVIIALMTFFTSCTGKEPENSDMFNEDWYENLGEGLKQILESKASDNPSDDIVAYINGIPIYKDEIIDRKTKLMLLNNIENPNWPTNPVEYVCRETYMYYYAAKNNIDVTDKEVNETLNFQKQQAENSEEFQKLIAEYLSRADMTIEQYWNVLAPKSYRNSILKSRGYKHILENLTGINIYEISPEEQSNYVNQFIKENMKIDVINKEFIDLYNYDIYELNN
ncbi:hypothetical protein J2Z76_002007 [Sedimentibacter acidaminivorans]|uniref:Uncharacterized protein n=1 Tax=Sedimentibacter acidaminivorans TaxID=913099 RepID=A0ABS4GEL8_9FIRM|nr:hypothetical protein [Sedimentibacter acidaminivorans]MBP1926143.1 hypothetical protein [Sedimentibacter acidaminivorans]